MAVELVRRLSPVPALRALYTRTIEDPLVRQRLGRQVHCFESGDDGVIFVKESVSILAASRSLVSALQRYLGGAGRGDSCRATGVLEAELEDLLALLLGKLGPVDGPATDRKDVRRLDRLVLNVSNSCNLRCLYCYAHGGTYGGEESFMDKRTALRTLDVFLTLFEGGVDKLQFFGGEPLLNLPVIRFVCQELALRHESGALEAPPQLSLVTNGTVLSREVLDTLKQFAIRPAISLDGPEAVNDHLRGRGTYQKATRFFQALKDEGIEPSFEGTYTAHHLQAGVSLHDLLDFFYEGFGQQEVHIPPAALKAGDPLSLSDEQAETAYRQAVGQSMQTLRTGGSACLSFASRMVNVFLERAPIEQYCPAGLATLSVDCQGNVYPCFMFTGIAEMQIGNVFDSQFPDAQKIERLRPLLSRNDKSQDPTCRDCWAAPFCSGCLARDYFVTDGSFERTGCSAVQAMAEEFLSKVVTFVPAQGGTTVRESAASHVQAAADARALSSR